MLWEEHGGDKSFLLRGMAKLESGEVDHPAGELNRAVEAGMPESEVNTFGGKIHVFWDPNAQVTALGPLTLLYRVSEETNYIFCIRRKKFSGVAGLC